MSETVVIARNAFRGLVHGRSLLLLGLGAIFLAPTLVSHVMVSQRATRAGETGLVSARESGLVVDVLQTWFVLTTLVAIFLGAALIASEVKARTIVPVLAKPVPRWAFLVGKWAGLQAYLACFHAVGLLLGTALALKFGLELRTFFWLHGIHAVIVTALISALAVLFGVLVHPIAAGIAVVLAATIGAFAAQAESSDHGALRLAGTVVRQVFPATPPDGILDLAFEETLLDAPVGLFVAVLVENAGYAVLLVAVACVLFTRREIRLR